MPPVEQRDTAEAEAHVIRTTRLFEAAGPAFQPRPARVLLCARLSRLVRQPLGAVRHHGGGRDRHLAPAIRLQRLEGDGELARRKILRREAEIEHFPFAVAVRRQHRVGLAGLAARRSRLASGPVPCGDALALDQDGLGREPAFLRHEHPQLDPDLSDGAIDAGSFRAGLQMTPKFRDQTGCDVGRLGRRGIEAIAGLSTGFRRGRPADPAAGRASRCT